MTYTKFSELSGDQTFTTSCGAIMFGGTPFAVGSTYFGDGYTIDYTASSQTYALDGFGIQTSFGPADVDATAPSTYAAYKRTEGNGFTSRFFYTAPTLASGSLDYVRYARVILQDSSMSPVDAFCVFGVPTSLDDDLPSSTLYYTTAAVRGTAFVRDAAGQHQFDLTESVTSLTADPSTGKVDVSVKLVGREFLSGGLSSTRTDLGTYTGSETIDGSNQSYGMTLMSSGHNSIGSQVGGWFFGPQGAEAGYTFSIRVDDGSLQIDATGAVTALPGDPLPPTAPPTPAS